MPRSPTLNYRSHEQSRQSRRECGAVITVHVRSPHQARPWDVMSRLYRISASRFRVPYTSAVIQYSTYQYVFYIYREYSP